MKKEGMGKRGQVSESPQLNASLLSISLIITSLAVLVSFVNPLAMALAKKILLLGSQAGLGLSIVALILSLISLLKNQKSIGLIMQCFALVFFNASFLFPYELIIFGLSLAAVVLGMIFAAVAYGKQQFKDMHATLLVTQVLLLGLQAMVVYFIIKGRLGA